jgi:GNAT superfamily N-acetyltransferase
MSMAIDTGEVAIKWCDGAVPGDRIADFFVAEADRSYISHSELRTGLAASPTTWAPELYDQLRLLISERAGGAAEEDGRIAVMMCAEALVGYAYVTFTSAAETSYATVEDLIVASRLRGSGLGARFLEWIAVEAHSRGIVRLFLESGVENHRAHAFFERHGFQQTSIMMMRDLD